MRLRITFSKTDAMRYTGHLDLQRTLERTIRRANLPLAYSEGYHAHPKLALAAPLSLGFTSTGEVADIWLKEEMPLDEVKAALEKAAPPGVVFGRIEAVDLRAPKIQTLLQSAEYILTLPEPVADLEQKVRTLLAKDEIPMQRQRKRKTQRYDLRQLIEHVAVIEPDSAGRQRLMLRLAAREGATGRPDEVLAELGVQAKRVGVERSKLVFENVS